MGNHEHETGDITRALHRQNVAKLYSVGLCDAARKYGPPILTYDAISFDSQFNGDPNAQVTIEFSKNGSNNSRIRSVTIGFDGVHLAIEGRVKTFLGFLPNKFSEEEIATDGLKRALNDPKEDIELRRISSMG